MTEVERLTEAMTAFRKREFVEGWDGIFGFKLHKNLGLLFSFKLDYFCDKEGYYKYKTFIPPLKTKALH